MKLTRRQEKFTLNLLAGMTQREAYLQAGYSAKPSMAVIDVNACRLAQNTKVLLRQVELNQKAESDKVAGVEERKQILSEIARVRMTDFLTVGMDGAYFDVGPEKLNTSGISSAGSKTVIDEEGNGQTVFTRVYLRNPIQAIAELNKMEHIYEADGVVHNDNRVINIIVATEKAKELTQRIIDGERTD